MVRTVAVALTEPVPVFELGVLCEVFGLDRTDLGLPRWELTVCGPRRGPVRSTTGVAVVPERDYAGLAAAELVMVPGALRPSAPPPPELVRQLHAAVDRGATVAAVCTGAFVLAAAGLLDGRRVTTHWRHAARLAREHPRVEVQPDKLYVEDGPVATSAGSTAAIDLCLHLVRREHGAEVANRLARDLVAPPHRAGGQAQFVETSVPDPRTGDDLGGVLAWAGEHLDAPLRVEDLAARALMSPRTFARRFREHTGQTPASWLAGQRLLLAERLLERDADSVAAVALRAGFGSTDTLRRHFARARGVTPEQYRRTFRLG